MEFASKALGNAGLTTGIIGTAGVGLGLLGNLLGVGNRMGCDYGVNHNELFLTQRISDLESQVALRDANIYNDQKMLDMYKYFDRKMDEVGGILSRQASYISQLQNACNTFSNLTKVVIPIDNICPEPMARYNSWVAPTTPAEDATT